LDPILGDDLLADTDASSLGPFDWRREVLQMAVRQGPAFLLLSLVLYGLYASGQYAMTTAVPSHLESIKSGYKEIAGQMEKSVDKMTVALEKDAARDTEQNKALLQKLEEINSTAKGNRGAPQPAKAAADHDNR
jgi:hypothetical protein